jgi:type I restriction enzyme S subunit
MSLHRIDELFNFEKGSLQSSKCEAGEYSFITASADWKTHKEFTYEGEALVFAAAAAGSLGRTHYVNDKFVASDLCFVLTPKDAENFPIDLKFYHLIFRELKNDIVKNTKAGTSKEAIGLGSFAKYRLPYFDIEKQTKIKNRFVVAEATKTNISTELDHQLALVKELRQAYLREAMQGKLVPQDPTDEPAAILLEKIKAEKEKLVAEKKIKQGKIQEPERQEVLFDVPSNWIWCLLDDICVKITDGTHQTPFYTTEGRIFLSAQNVKPFRFMPEVHRFVSEDAYQKYIRNRKAEKGDLLVARVGAGIGEAAVIDKDLDFAFYVSLGLVKPFQEFLNSEYLAIVLNSPFGVNYAKGNISSKGGSAGNFNLGRIRSFPFPLPPLAEQERIVAKLETLMKFCDELEANIKQGITNADRLLQTALKEALAPKEAITNRGNGK